MACIGTISALGAVLTLASAGDDRSLAIGAEASFPPYVELAADGSLTGHDYELMQEICARLARQCDWQTVTFEELIPGVIEGRFDVVLGGMAITPERRRLVDFTTSYAPGGGLDWFVGPPEAPQPDKALISVEAGTIHESYLQAEGLSYHGYPTEFDALKAVAGGQADMALGPYQGRPELDELIYGKGLEFLLSVEIPDEGVGMAVCRGNTALLNDLNATLEAMRKDGALDALESRWF
ncbi:substrate-binding periplasmic protein [Pseudogemmobacter blasticus]|uniref:Solute-binding protein family 3/N-terminal domain-containing protein n=1 Tax=Fuscovulum blasticum DSM 2131 TaxID=1188250 RepID=A0A2T4J8R6_FUSBL|nr:transporter substrate-binding domain-containing protein [Fuscovulum blasticum]PTE14284.1 hypothetical protein C5F44_09805 [Fuscovulum blasticum DSM 2131]